jgi:hypothetical protein
VNKLHINIMVLASIIIYVLNGVSLAAESVVFQKIDPNQVPAELMMLSATTKANYEKLKSWQGNTVFQSIIVYQGKVAADKLKRAAGVESAKEPNELMETAEGTTEFKINLENNRIFTHWNRPQPMIYTDLDKECVYTSLAGSLEQTRIITPEYEIESYPDHFNANRTIVTRRIARKHKPGSRGIFEDLDPRECFNIGRPVWHLLSQLSESIEYNNKGVETFGVILEKGKTTKDNVVYRIQVTDPKSNQPIFKIILKEEMGFNPAEIEVRNNKGILESQISTDFVKIEEIFLPVKRQVKQYHGSDGSLRRDAIRTITNTQINAKLPDKTFSVDNCGLQDGDRFVDEFNNKNYTYKGEGKLIDANSQE